MPDNAALPRIKSALVELMCAAGELTGSGFTLLKDGEVWETVVRYKPTHGMENGKFVEFNDVG